MINKRFIKDPIFEENTLLPLMDNGNRLFLNDVVELLNDLHQENHSLKFQLDECANNKLYSRRKLEEENKQLRQQVANYELAKRNLIKRLDDREKEDFERFFK